MTAALQIHPLLKSSSWNMFLLSAPRTFNLDIALVKLAWPVDLTDHVNIACLPAEEDIIPKHAPCVTAGWGHTVEGAA